MIVLNSLGYIALGVLVVMYINKILKDTFTEELILDICDVRYGQYLVFTNVELKSGEYRIPEMDIRMSEEQRKTLRGKYKAKVVFRKILGIRARLVELL